MKLPPGVRKAADPFARVLAIIDGLGEESDDYPLREYLPGAWPLVGELRKLIVALDMERETTKKRTAR
jgi:hypothetical protein